MVLITRKNWGGGWLGWITADSTDTLTNKTLDDYTNFIHADWIHLRVKATEALVKWDVVKFVWFNNGEQAIEVAKRNSTSVPAIWVIHTDTMDTWDFGMAVSNWLFKNIDTSAFSVWDILYPNTSGWFTATNPWWYAQQLAYVVRSHAINGEIMINVWPVYWMDKRGLTGNSGANPSTNFIGTTDAQPLVIKTNNTERVRVLSGGNVWIGTNNPTAPLHIVSSSNTFKFNNWWGWNTPNISLWNSSGKSAWLLTGGSWSAFIFDSTWYFAITKDTKANIDWWSSSGGTLLMTVLNSGNVGILTSNPLKSLHVVWTASVLTSISAYNGAIIENSDNVQLAIITWTARECVISFGDTGNNNIGKILYSNTTDSMAFTVNNAERIRINSSGNVWVWTTTPASKLTTTWWDIEVTDISSGVILKSPNWTRWRITVWDDWALTTTAL